MTEPRNPGLKTLLHINDKYIGFTALGKRKWHRSFRFKLHKNYRLIIRKKMLKWILVFEDNVKTTCFLKNASKCKNQNLKSLKANFCCAFNPLKNSLVFLSIQSEVLNQGSVERALGVHM